MSKVTPLTDEESEIVSDNERLIGSFLGHYNLDEADWYGFIAEALIQSVKDHDSGRGTLSTLFYSIARNRMFNERRYQRRRNKVGLLGFTDTVENDYRLDSGVIDSHLELAFFDMRDDQRIIVRHIYEGLNHREIALELGVSRSTVTRMLHSMREEVGELLT